MAEPRDGRFAAAIAEALAPLALEEALDRLLLAGVPAAPAIEHGALFSDPFLHENGFFDRHEHPDHGTVTGVRRYAAWSRTPGGFVRRAPLLGEHSVEVLREFGFDEERIAALMANGVTKI
jgi:formyl-CoA transferase